MSVPEVGWNAEIASQIVAVTEHWIVSVTPMIYNDRVVLSRLERDEWRTGYVAGFCYDKGGSAILAALAWDPEVDREPVGYKKVAADARNGSLL